MSLVWDLMRLKCLRNIKGAMPMDLEFKRKGGLEIKIWKSQTVSPPYPQVPHP